MPPRVPSDRPVNRQGRRPAPARPDQSSATATGQRRPQADAPPADLDTRSLVIERVLAADVGEHDYAQARYQPLRSWSRVPMRAAVRTSDDDVTLALTAPDLDKTLRFSRDGCLEIVYRWATEGLPEGAVFAPELSRTPRTST